MAPTSLNETVDSQCHSQSCVTYSLIWYCLSRWIIWARVVCKDFPIVNSNVIAEILWVAFKKRYLRKQRRGKLELHTDIIVTQYLPQLERLIMGHCSLVEKPVWQVLQLTRLLTTGITDSEWNGGRSVKSQKTITKQVKILRFSAHNSKQFIRQQSSFKG